MQTELWLVLRKHSERIRVGRAFLGCVEESTLHRHKKATPSR